MADFDLISFIIVLTAALVLVLINAFFVAAEFALVSVRPSKIQELIQKTGSRRAKAVKLAIDHQDEAISATQLGITMASLALGFLAGAFIEPVLEGLFEDIGLLAILGGLSIGGILAFALTTYLHVVLGELAPKSLALQYPVRTSLWIAGPLRWFGFVFKPIIWLFNRTGWLVLSIFGIKEIIGHRYIHSEEELKLLISQSSKAGILEERESAILKSTFDLPDTQIRMIMTPRPDMATVSINDKFIDIIKIVNSTGHSRFPVYDENKEDIIGFLYAKDLLEYMVMLLDEDSELIVENVNISELLRDADYVPETMRADLLLGTFQENKRHSAIVVDEFGQVAGLITLEDILELLVGDIQDEYDIEPAEISPLIDSDGEMKVVGQTSLDDFNEYFKTNFESEISVTIGGLVIEKLGRIPKEKETFKFQDLLFTVEEVTKSRIVTLLVHGISEEKKKAINNANDIENTNQNETNYKES